MIFPFTDFFECEDFPNFLFTIEQNRREKRDFVTSVPLILSVDFFMGKKYNYYFYYYIVITAFK